MIFELKSSRLLVNGDCLQITRVNSFRFWQWASFIIETAIIIGVGFIICINNIEKIKLIFLDRKYSEMAVLITGFIAGVLLISLFYRNVKKSTSEYKLAKSSSQIFVNSRLIGDKNSIKDIMAIKNPGWRGLGMTYTVALKTHASRIPLVYYLDNNEAEEVVKILKDFVVV